MSPEVIKAFLMAVDTGEILDLLRKTSMPNIPTVTMGGKTFWNVSAQPAPW